jgi:hypothetical protein
MFYEYIEYFRNQHCFESDETLRAMKDVDGRNLSCLPCIKGHRVSKCGHSQRLLRNVGGKGRPRTQCVTCVQRRAQTSFRGKCACASLIHAEVDVMVYQRVEPQVYECDCTITGTCEFCQDTTRSRRSFGKASRSQNRSTIYKGKLTRDSPNVLQSAKEIATVSARRVQEKARDDEGQSKGRAQCGEGRTCLLSASAVPDITELLHVETCCHGSQNRMTTTIVPSNLPDCRFCLTCLIGSECATTAQVDKA